LSSSSSIILLRVKRRSAKRCTEQNSDKTEKIRPPSFKNLVDFLSLSLSLLTRGDDSDKPILQPGRRASFTLLSIFCLRRRALLLLLLLLLLCVLSFSLEDDDARAEGRRKSGCLVCRKRRKKREKREKKRGKQDLIGQRAPSLREKDSLLLGGEIFFFLFFVLRFLFLARTLRRTNSSSSRERV